MGLDPAGALLPGCQTVCSSVHKQPPLPLPQQPCLVLPLLPPSCFAGGLGLIISQWLVQRSGPAYIHLLSRSGRVADAAAASLAATAACISSVMSDAGSPADAATALGAAAGLGPALQAVLHASGVLADGLLDKQTAGSFRWVLLLDMLWLL